MTFACRQVGLRGLPLRALPATDQMIDWPGLLQLGSPSEPSLRAGCSPPLLGFVHFRPSVDAHLGCPLPGALGLPSVGQCQLPDLVPPSRFLTALTACSTRVPRACCIPLPTMRFAVFPTRAASALPRGADSARSCVFPTTRSHPSKNSPRRQPCRVTTASALLSSPLASPVASRWLSPPRSALSGPACFPARRTWLPGPTEAGRGRGRRPPPPPERARDRACRGHRPESPPWRGGLSLLAAHAQSRAHRGGPAPVDCLQSSRRRRSQEQAPAGLELGPVALAPCEAPRRLGDCPRLRRCHRCGLALTPPGGSVLPGVRGLLAARRPGVRRLLTALGQSRAPMPRPRSRPCGHIRAGLGSDPGVGRSLRYALAHRRSGGPGLGSTSLADASTVSGASRPRARSRSGRLQGLAPPTSP